MIEKIKAELERRVAALGISDDELSIHAELSELLSFIDSLEKEQETIQITPPTFAPISTEPGKDGSVIKKDQSQSGYISNPCAACVNDKGCVTCEHYNMRETQPQGLDEAAEEYVNKTGHDGRIEDYDGSQIRAWEFESMVDCFKAGAEWMAGQGETVEGEIKCAVAYPHEPKVIARIYGDYGYGDKVIVQIRKAK